MKIDSIVRKLQYQIFIRMILVVGLIGAVGLGSNVCLINSAAAEPVYVVALINFDCAHCKSFDSYHERIKEATELTGGKYIVAPLPTDPIRSVVRELVYYAGRNQGVEVEIRKAFYSVQSDFQFDSVTDAVEWLKVHTKLDINFNLLKQEAHLRELAPMKKALKLGTDAGVTRYPSFLHVSSAGVLLINDDGSVADRVHSLERYIKKESEK